MGTRLNIRSIEGEPHVLARTRKNKHTQHVTRNYGTKQRCDAAELIKDMMNKTIITSIKQAVQAYDSKELRVCTVLGDVKFRHIQKLI